MRVVVLLVQILVAFVLTASLMPAVLFAIPPAREGGIGLALAASVMAATFFLVWLAWPRRRR